MSDKENQIRIKIKNFNPIDITSEQILDWVKSGDIEEAEQIAISLAWFLKAMSDDKDAQQQIMKKGIPWIGADTAAFISEKLLASPSVANGKKHKIAIKAFAKILVPIKTSKSQFTARKLAYLTYQLGSANDDNLDFIVRSVNNGIDKNKRIKSELSNGNFKNENEFIPFWPSTKVTSSQVRAAYKKYYPEIKSIENPKK